MITYFSVLLSVQVNRLKHHASILVWSGNNENEVAIASPWWGALNYTHEQMVVDYKFLFMDTMKPLIERLDQSRPFLLSSPSNGIESEKQVTPLWLRSAEDAVAVQPVEAVLNNRFSVSEAWKREALALVKLSR
jgi:beta-galactosidase/beta-glucuronidase